MNAQQIVRPWFNRHLLLGAAAWLLFTLPAGTAGAAGGNQEAVAKVVRLNKEFRQFYDAAEFALAEKSLKKALEVGEAASLGSHVVMAGTHGNLGILYATGIKNEDQALLHFKQALEMRPEYTPGKDANSSEVNDLFQRARSEKETPTESPGSDTSEPAGASQGPLRCPAANMATAGSSLKLRCVADSSLAATEVVVYFRAGDASPFRSRKMSTESALDGSPSWGTQLPPEATSGDQLFLYFQARNKRGRVVGSVGSADQPTVVGIRSSARGSTATGSGSGQGDGEDEGENGAAKTSGYWWLGFGVGIGYGYAGSSGPEVYHGQIDHYKSGMSMAKAGQLTPEVGYFLTQSLSLSLQTRFQFIPQAGNPTAWEAIVFLGRLLYFVGGKSFRFYVGPIVGAGQGFRMYVEGLKRINGGVVNDTVIGGPIVLGAGGGIAIGLGDIFEFFLRYVLAQSGSNRKE